MGGSEQAPVLRGARAMPLPPSVLFDHRPLPGRAVIETSRLSVQCDWTRRGVSCARLCSPTSPPPSESISEAARGSC